METWGFSAERVGKKPTLFVRGYFWFFNYNFAYNTLTISPKLIVSQKFNSQKYILVSRKSYWYCL